MPIDTAVRAISVESAKPSVANSSTGRVEGLVDMMDLRITNDDLSQSSIQIPAPVRPDLGEAVDE
jgi:hypothetical protein